MGLLHGTLKWRNPDASIDLNKRLFGVVSKGIYDGDPQNPPAIAPIALQGTVQVTNGLSTVVGTSTSFDTQLVAGNLVTFGTDPTIYEVNAAPPITATTFSTTVNYGAASQLTAICYRVYPASPFSVGAFVPHVVPGPGALQVSVLPFVAMSADGMLISHEGTPQVLTVAASTVQYVVCRAKYLIGSDPVITLEVLTSAAYAADVDRAQVFLGQPVDYLIVLAKIASTIGPITTTHLTFNENHIVNSIGRNFLRGHVADLATLNSTPLNDPKIVVTGDIYLAMLERQFYQWSGAAWQAVGDQIVLTTLTQHLAVSGPGAGGFAARDGFGYPSHPANAISFTQATGNVTSGTVQAALDTKVVAKAGDTMTGTLNINTTGTLTIIGSSTGNYGAQITGKTGGIIGRGLATWGASGIIGQGSAQVLGAGGAGGNFTGGDTLDFTSGDGYWDAGTGVATTGGTGAIQSGIGISAVGGASLDGRAGVGARITGGTTGNDGLAGVGAVIIGGGVTDISTSASDGIQSIGGVGGGGGNSNGSGLIAWGAGGTRVATDLPLGPQGNGDGILAFGGKDGSGGFGSYAIRAFGGSAATSPAPALYAIAGVATTSGSGANGAVIIATSAVTSGAGGIGATAQGGSGAGGGGGSHFGGSGIEATGGGAGTGSGAGAGSGVGLKATGGTGNGTIVGGNGVWAVAGPTGGAGGGHALRATGVADASAVTVDSSGTGVGVVITSAGTGSGLTSTAANTGNSASVYGINGINSSASNGSGVYGSGFVGVSGSGVTGVVGSGTDNGLGASFHGGYTFAAGAGRGLEARGGSASSGDNNDGGMGAYVLGGNMSSANPADIAATGIETHGGNAVDAGHGGPGIDAYGGTGAAGAGPAIRSTGEHVWTTGGIAVYKRTTDLAVTGSVSTDITLPTAEFTASGGITFADPTFTVPPGVYSISYHVSIDDPGAPNLTLARILVNGTAQGSLSTFAQSPAGIYTLSATSVVRVPAGASDSWKLNVLTTTAGVTVKLAAVAIHRIPDNT